MHFEPGEIGIFQSWNHSDQPDDANDTGTMRNVCQRDQIDRLKGREGVKGEG